MPLVYQTEKPTSSEINLLYLIIVTTACHSCCSMLYILFTREYLVSKKVLRLINNGTTAFCLIFKISFALDR